MNLKRWIHAHVVLGLALARHLLVLPFRARGASARWLGQIAQENLGRTPEGNWQSAVSASSCIQCGLCSALAPESPTRFDHLIAAHGRRPEDSPWTRNAILLLRKYGAALDEVCPVGVRAGDVADVMERNAAVLREAARSS